MQIFTGNPRGWESRNLGTLEISEFRKKSVEYDISPVAAHMPYLPNLASGNEDTRNKSVYALRENADRCAALGVRYLVLHLGSHLGEGVGKGIRNVAIGIDDADIPNGVIPLLENSAGQKNSVGSRLEELGELQDRIGRDRIGFCLDTCHLFAAGYDIREDSVIDDIDSEIGLDNVRMLHLNDAKYELGSGRDRHDNIGKGEIGTEGFLRFFGYAGMSGKPMIMETPELPRNEELEELRLLRKIVGMAAV